MLTDYTQVRIRVRVICEFSRNERESRKCKSKSSHIIENLFISIEETMDIKMLICHNRDIKMLICHNRDSKMMIIN